jgi:hypothetical protein
VSWSTIARNLRHIHLHIEPEKTPIFGEISLAARCDLNSCKAFSRILLTRVEGATRIVCFVVLAIVKFEDIWLDD